MLAAMAGRAAAKAAVPTMPGMSRARQTVFGWPNETAASAASRMATEQASRDRPASANIPNHLARLSGDDMTIPARQPNAPPAMPMAMPGTGAKEGVNHGAFMMGCRL
jgi:hypothetical protein